MGDSKQAGPSSLHCFFIGLSGFNASVTARVISSGFLVEETGVPGGNHRPVGTPVVDLLLDTHTTMVYNSVLGLYKGNLHIQNPLKFFGGPYRME